MIDFLNVEFVMTFLIGLNESYSQIRVQILLIDPLPPIFPHHPRRKTKIHWIFTFY